jgi:hypothetical protein
VDGDNGSQERALANRDGAATPADPAAQAAPTAAGKSLRYRAAGAIMLATSRTRGAWKKSSGAKLAALIARKGVRYWIGTLIFLVAGWELSQRLYEVRDVSVYRAYYFQWLFEHGPRAAYAKYVRLELIGDREFSSIGGTGKPPTEEVYLARLVSQLAQPDAHANVIAIDFDYGTSDERPNNDDDCTLVDSIHAAVAHGSRVVLPVAVMEDQETGGLYRAPDIYEAFGLCPADRTVKPAQCGGQYHTAFDAAQQSRIACGYLALPADFARIPTRWSIDDHNVIESFALKIARATEPKISENVIAAFQDQLPIGHFLDAKAFSRAGHEFAADSYPSDEINGATVIIGAAWHTLGENQGPLIDLHDTPAARMVGAMLHANYVEALLDQRTASALSKWGAEALEIGFAVAAVFAFAAFPGWRGVGALLPLIAAMLAAQWVVLHTFGVYFDVLIVLLGLAIHSFLEHLFGSHGHAPAPPGAPAAQPEG